MAPVLRTECFSGASVPHLRPMGEWDAGHRPDLAFEWEHQWVNVCVACVSEHACVCMVCTRGPFLRLLPPATGGLGGSCFLWLCGPSWAGCEVCWGLQAPDGVRVCPAAVSSVGPWTGRAGLLTLSPSLGCGCHHPPTAQDKGSCIPGGGEH